MLILFKQTESENISFSPSTYVDSSNWGRVLIIIQSIHGRLLIILLQLKLVYFLLLKI